MLSSLDQIRKIISILQDGKEEKTIRNEKENKKNAKK
jgi:hypothetical protein